MVAVVGDAARLAWSTPATGSRRLRASCRRSSRGSRRSGLRGVHDFLPVRSRIDRRAAAVAGQHGRASAEKPAARSHGPTETCQPPQDRPTRRGASAQANPISSNRCTLDARPRIQLGPRHAAETVRVVQSVMSRLLLQRGCDGSSPQAPARRKRLTAKNQSTERMATSSSANSHGAGRAQPATTAAPAPTTIARLTGR